jgi:hypothetical protein
LLSLCRLILLLRVLPLSLPSKQSPAPLDLHYRSNLLITSASPRIVARLMSFLLLLLLFLLLLSFGNTLVASP